MKIRQVDEFRTDLDLVKEKELAWRYLDRGAGGEIRAGEVQGYVRENLLAISRTRLMSEVVEAPNRTLRL